MTKALGPVSGKNHPEMKMVTRKRAVFSRILIANWGIAIEGPSALAQMKIGAKIVGEWNRALGKVFGQKAAVRSTSGPPANSFWPTPGHFKWENGWPPLFFVSDAGAVFLGFWLESSPAFLPREKR